MQTNCTLLAKVVVNKKLQTLRIVFSFDKYNRITVRNAVYATGDICPVDYENANLELAKAIQVAKDTMRCSNVQIVN